MDLSRADFAIGKQMALDGFSGKKIGEAIEQCSPELPMRKAGHEVDYLARTVKAAQDAAEVVRAQERAEREEIARRLAKQLAEKARKRVEKVEERSAPRDRDRGLSR